MDNSFYHWTVVSSDAHGGSVESKPSMFWTDTYPEPPFPFLALSPADDSQGISGQVEFIWNIAHDPDPLDFATYKLVYATDWADSSTYTSVEGIEDSTVSISLNNNSEYFWLVEAVDKDGLITESNDGQPMRLVVGMLDIYESNQIPTVFALHQNYPNPFNPTTTFKYELPKESKVVLSIFDMNGRLVKTIVNQTQSAGYYSIQWDAAQHSSGVYIYRIRADGFSAVKKCILIK
jgi:hypothetical protein